MDDVPLDNTDFELHSVGVVCLRRDKVSRRKTANLRSDLWLTPSENKKYNRPLYRNFGLLRRGCVPRGGWPYSEGGGGKGAMCQDLRYMYTVYVLCIIINFMFLECLLEDTMQCLQSIVGELRTKQLM